jgi:hypothetical protein
LVIGDEEEKRACAFRAVLAVVFELETEFIEHHVPGTHRDRPLQSIRRDAETFQLFDFARQQLAVGIEGSGGAHRCDEGELIHGCSPGAFPRVPRQHSRDEERVAPCVSEL